MPKKNVRFDYYRVVQIDEEKGEERVFDLSHLIHRALELREEKKEEALRRETKSGVIRLSHCRSEEQNYYALSFIKHRTVMPPGVSNFRDEAVRDLDLQDGEFISEDLNILYSHRQHILLMQKNRMVASPSVLAEYIKSVMGEPGVNYEVRPLMEADALRKMTQAAEVTQMVVRLDAAPAAERGLAGTLNAMLTGFTADSVEIVLKRRKGKGGLNRKRIQENAADGREFFSKLAVDVIDDEKIDSIDLLGGVMHETIPFALEPGQRLYSDYAVAQMRERFDKRAGALYNLLKKGGLE